MWIGLLGTSTVLLGAAHAATIEKPTSIFEEAVADTDLPMPQCQVNRLMCADFSSHRTLMKGGKHDCTVRFLSFPVLLGLREKDQSCHHEVLDAPGTC